jgi:hypothetical protein
MYNYILISLIKMIQKELLYFIHFPTKRIIPFKNEEYAHEYYDTYIKTDENVTVLDWNMAVNIKGIKSMNKLYDEIVQHNQGKDDKILYRCSSSCHGDNHSLPNEIDWKQALSNGMTEFQIKLSEQLRLLDAQNNNKPKPKSWKPWCERSFFTRTFRSDPWNHKYYNINS